MNKFSVLRALILSAALSAPLAQVALADQVATAPPQSEQQNATWSGNPYDNPSDYQGH